LIGSVELRSVTAFSDLPDGQIEWFLNHVHEVSLHAGETFVRQGDPADWMFIFLAPE
jgi:CRP-like cAMP-binding protein